MKKLPAILGLLLLICIFFPGCEVENCPPNSMSYAYFSLVDQHGRSFNTSDTITIVGQTHADIVVYDTLPDGSLQPRTVQDSLVSDTLINKEAGASSFELPFRAIISNLIITYLGICSILTAGQFVPFIIGQPVTVFIFRN